MPNSMFPRHQEVCFYAVKYCKIVIFCTFFERGSYKNQGIDMKFNMDKLSGVGYVHTKFHVSWTSKKLFLCCKISQNCNFWYFSERGSYKNWGMDIKVYRNKLAGVRNVCTKFHVSQTSGSLFLYCRILHICYFLYFLELGSYKNRGIDMKFYMDKLEKVNYVHTKFQVSWISGSLFLCC